MKSSKLYAMNAKVKKLAEEKSEMRLELDALKLKIDEVIFYCRPHADIMWAASVAGILLECDYKDATYKLRDLTYPRYNDPRRKVN